MMFRFAGLPESPAAAAPNFPQLTGQNWIDVHEIVKLLDRITVSVRGSHSQLPSPAKRFASLNSTSPPESSQLSAESSGSADREQLIRNSSFSEYPGMEQSEGLASNS